MKLKNVLSRAARAPLRPAAVAILATAAGLFASQASAQGVSDELHKFWSDFESVRDSEGATRKLRLEYENDVFFNTDRNYTNGVRAIVKYVGSQNVGLTTQDADSWFPPYTFERDADHLDDEDCEPGPNGELPKRICVRKTYSWVIGHTLYTPSNIRLAGNQIAPSDRPYAAWFYTGLYRELYANDGRYWRYGVDIGCTGSCAHGEQVQSWIHRHITDSPQPQGWSEQIHQEFGFVFRYEHVPVLWTVNPYIQVRPIVDFGVGTIQTYAGTGVTVRVGIFRPQYLTNGLDNHPIESLARADTAGDAGRRREMPMFADASPVLASALVAAEGAGQTASDAPKRVDEGTPVPNLPLPHALRSWAERKAGRYDLYAFGRLHATGVAYNALLQGGMLNQSSPMKGDPRPVIFEAEAGMTFGYGDFQLTASVVNRTTATNLGLTNERTYRFGRLAAEWAF